MMDLAEKFYIISYSYILNHFWIVKISKIPVIVVNLQKLLRKEPTICNAKFSIQKINIRNKCRCTNLCTANDIVLLGNG